GTPREVFTHAEEITAAGLDVPEITKVFLELRRRGVPVDPSIYTVEQALAAIRALKEGTPC
ncbi:MAG: energy-coupling factor transporter ATPase, partial [Intestinibacillus sp.]